MIVTAHGIEFVREGYCHQCGACGCGDCPHHFEMRGKHWCDIYHTRDQFCQPCDSTHVGCIGFPDNPWIRHIRSGVCGFTFRRLDGGSMDELPFLRGEPWLRA